MPQVPTWTWVCAWLSGVWHLSVCYPGASPHCLVLSLWGVFNPRHNSGTLVCWLRTDKSNLRLDFPLFSSSSRTMWDESQCHRSTAEGRNSFNSNLPFTSLLNRYPGVFQTPKPIHAICHQQRLPYRCCSQVPLPQILDTTAICRSAGQKEREVKVPQCDIHGPDN